METIKPTISYSVVIGKDAGRALSDEKMRKQVDTVVSSVNTAQRSARGWEITIAYDGDDDWYTVSEGEGTAKRYDVTLAVNCSKPGRTTMDSEFANILATLDSRGAASKWAVVTVDGRPYIAPSLAERAAEQTDIGYAPIEIPDSFDSYFSHLYGLDAHISRVRRALDAAVLSGWQHRFHCALIGPPGCGKSDICQSLKNALGDEAVLEFDATSTTMAGAQKELGERDELPRVILIEEIEKAPEASMAFLLSILDLRGEIRKTTARGNIIRDARMLAIATVNDLDTFKRANFGALQSRFANKVFFERPSRGLLSKILEREILRVDGNTDWIKPALDYAAEIDTTDPREVISIALCGRDGLLTGEYQNECRATRERVKAHGG